MADVRAQHAFSQSQPLNAANRLVVRTAQASCSCASVLILYVITTGLIPEPLAIHVLLGDPALTQLLSLLM